jgi:MATE family multidrug resistance protein
MHSNFIETINKIDTKNIWLIAIPFILGTLWDPIINLIDTSVAGHMESAEFLASLTYGNNVVHIFYWVFGSIGMAITGFTSQKSGQKDESKIFKILITSISFMSIISIFLYIFQFQLWNVFSLIFNQSQSVEILTKDFFFIRIIGVAPQLIIMSTTSWFLGIKKPNIIFKTWSLMGITHILLLIVFTNYYNMKLNGIAYAVVISQWITLVYVFIETILILKKLNINIIYKFLPKEDITLLLKSFFDLFIRTLMLQSIYLVGTYYSSNLGATTLASYGIFLQLSSVSYMVIDGPTLGSAPLIGESYGAKKINQFKRIYNNAFFSGILTAILFTLIYIVFGKNLINIITDIETVRLESFKYIYLVSIIPIASVLSFQLDGAFSGMLKTKEMRNTMIFASLIYFISIFTLTKIIGNYGVWVSYIIFALSRGLSLNYYMKQIINKLK